MTFDPPGLPVEQGVKRFLFFLSLFLAVVDVFEMVRRSRGKPEIRGAERNFSGEHSAALLKVDTKHRKQLQ